MICDGVTAAFDQYRISVHVTAQFEERDCHQYKAHRPPPIALGACPWPNPWQDLGASGSRFGPRYACFRLLTDVIVKHMPLPKLTKPELQIMEALWSNGPQCIRDILETFPKKNRPVYATVQTVVYRLEVKGALRRVRKIGNAHIFEALVPRNAARGRLIDDLLGMFGGRTMPVMTHLAETGKLTLQDIHETEALLKTLARKKEGR